MSEPKADSGAAVPCISLLDIVAELKKTMQCNCDLDNWEPERDTGHSWVCRIHKAAKARMSNAGAVPRRGSDVGTSPLLGQKSEEA